MSAAALLLPCLIAATSPPVELHDNYNNAFGVLVPLGLAASRNKLLQQFWENAAGKSL